MAVNDAIGELAGGVIYLWPGDANDNILEDFEFPTERSGIKLAIDLGFLEQQSPEIAAALIAEELYRDFSQAFNTSAYRIAGINARDIVARFPWHSADDKTDLPETGKWFVEWTGTDERIVRRLQEVAWLRHAFDAGATPADLLDWGVDPFTVVQLIWWQRKPDETLLARHIRAIRNGWGLRWLEEAARDTYRNLIKFVDQGAAHQAFLDAFEVELAEVRELLAFFADDAEQLSPDRQTEWAIAFGENDHLRILPDAVGRFGQYVPAALKRGVLRRPLEPVARYLESIGVTPETWPEFDEAWFGRS
jgi:hypothetical protein